MCFMRRSLKKGRGEGGMSEAVQLIFMYVILLLHRMLLYNNMSLGDSYRLPKILYKALHDIE